MTVPWEAFDDTHGDHAGWVERNGPRFCADDCALHPLPDTTASPAAARTGDPASTEP